MDQLIITKDDRKKIESAAYDLELDLFADDGYGDEGINWRTSYSGRGMFGSSCVGFTTGEYGGAADLAKFVLAVSQALGSDVAVQIADATRTDSMGRGVIYYFPGVVAEGWSDDEDEDED